jgi:hypothetical protein
LVYDSGQQCIHILKERFEPRWMMYHSMMSSSVQLVLRATENSVSNYEMRFMKTNTNGHQYIWKDFPDFNIFRTPSWFRFPMVKVSGHCGHHFLPFNLSSSIYISFQSDIKKTAKDTLQNDQIWINCFCFYRTLESLIVQKICHFYWFPIEIKGKRKNWWVFYRWRKSKASKANSYQLYGRSPTVKSITDD